MHVIDLFYILLYSKKLRRNMVHLMGGVAAWIVHLVGHDPPKILVGWATMHLAPPIIGLYVR